MIFMGVLLPMSAEVGSDRVLTAEANGPWEIEGEVAAKGKEPHEN